MSLVLDASGYRAIAKIRLGVANQLRSSQGSERSCLRGFGECLPLWISIALLGTLRYSKGHGLMFTPCHF